MEVSNHLIKDEKRKDMHLTITINDTSTLKCIQFNELLLLQGTAPTKDYCSLEDYPEGPIGKLQVLKSGRCRLILGDISFDMRMGTPSSFYEVINTT